ncbi:MAG: hypothetical protein GWP04_12205 [Gammaproteobacteria bacterium]|nr:hypothetical protein [Gammaproteobacteria bacterium]
MRIRVSPADPKVVTDTVVLRYFLAVEHTEFLIELVDGSIAVERELILVTDDSDALKVYRQLHPDSPYLRIRKLLRLAIARRLIGRAEANSIHADTRDAGFWDTGVPFDAT